ncbi:MAG: hypothetical protein NWE86_01325 [Candidatus Bathyarchaeota archaeon]|nr:hypothetical protein [Candidatus Bathyarchaeota archaeon]
MKKLSIFIPIFLTSVLLLMPIAPVQSNSIYLHSYTTTPPVIDGDLNSFVGEWTNAAIQEFDTTSGPSKHGKIYVMNTQTDLFIAIEIDDGANDGNKDFIQIFFDNDDDGTAEYGDDILEVYGDSTFEDRFNKADGSNTLDTNDLGSNDGSGAASYGSGLAFFEMSHPLKSGDTGHDFQLSFGDIVGFTLRYRDEGTGTYSYWPTTSTSEGSTEDYGDIGIDSPKNVVGGIYASTDKLNILTPYIALVGLIGAISTIFAIRRWRKD